MSWLILLLFAAIAASLLRALHALTDNKSPQIMAKALTVRVALSLCLFLLVIASKLWGAG